MTTPSREAIFAALFARLSGAYSWGSTPSRKFKLWSDVPAGSMPALYQFEGDHDEEVWQDDLLLIRTLKCRLFVYINANGDSNVGATQINNILDAIDAVLLPSSPLQTFQTLGGLVSSCRVSGQILKDPGDLDGVGLIVIPIQIVWP